MSCNCPGPHSYTSGMITHLRDFDNFEPGSHPHRTDFYSSGAGTVWARLSGHRVASADPRKSHVGWMHCGDKYSGPFFGGAERKPSESINPVRLLCEVAMVSGPARQSLIPSCTSTSLSPGLEQFFVLR